MFHEKLNEYFNLLHCSGKEFAARSGLSEATVSRYRSGARTPKPHSSDMKKICRAISAMAAKAGIPGITDPSVSQELNRLAEEALFDYEGLQTKLDMLCSVLSVNVADMAKSLKYDPSYLSRIRSGKRRPANPQKFAFDAAQYFSQSFHEDTNQKIIAEIIGTAPEQIKTQGGFAAAIADWLTSSNAKKPDNPMKKFLETLDAFDLNEYSKAVRFDTLKVPSLPFQLPAKKTYYGVEEMKNGELDFLKATALSKSKQDVFMCSDMQMDDMAADAEFSKKYMFGLAVMLKKRLHLHVVHNLNRPFHELMLGLACWIPLYMTGQISPYYLKGVHNQIFCHFLNVSGAAALSGECIAGFHAKGKYYLTKSKDELSYYLERSACILEKANRLMDIYRDDRAEELSAWLLADAHAGGARRSILSAPPLYTASEDFLVRFLDRRNVPAEKKEKILSHAAASRNRILEILKTDTVSDEVPTPNQDAFLKQPPALSLSLMFCEETFAYTYQEYIEHLRLTEEFAKKKERYSVIKTRESAFFNIQINIRENEYVMISKNKAPAIHFIVRHPILREAIEHLDFSSLI